MNLLFDFLNLYNPTGGSEYMRRVFFECMKQIKENPSNNLLLYGVYDSTHPIFYEDMKEEVLNKQYGIIFIDISGKTFPEIIYKYKIDRFFISSTVAIGYEYPSITDVTCEVICVTHDIWAEECYSNQMDYYYKFIRTKYFNEDRKEAKWKFYFRFNDSTYKLMHWLFCLRRDRILEKRLNYMKPIIKLLRQNNKCQNIVVSDYTKASMMYNFSLIADDIKVLWSPERCYTNTCEEADDLDLKNLIVSKKKYYLLVSANRESKNPHKTIRAFQKFCQLNKDAYLLTIGYESKAFDNMINVSRLSDSDLALAYKNCYALLYPSFFEGFGYPPLEAMRYGKPVLCSNATSMPEIFGDAPIWFSPLYETGIFQALIKLEEGDYEEFSIKSRKQYQKIKDRQDKDLQTLVNLILK